jgi:hypothetical protein
MKYDESNESGTTPRSQQDLNSLDPNRFELDAEHAASAAKDFERAQDDGWNPVAPECGRQESPELVASAWRVLGGPYAFPHEAEYREAAAKSGHEVISSVQPEDGGFRHELVLEPGTSGPDASDQGTAEAGSLLCTVYQNNLPSRNGS